MTIDDKEIYTKKEAAQYLQCSPQTIVRLARSGQIKYFRVGNRMRFFGKELIKIGDK